MCCRINGWCGGDVPLRFLLDAAHLQRHGGPDDLAVAHGDRWGVAACRLAIVDVDRGQQPYSLDGITVVYNGEIYNHSALRDDLRSKGYVFTDCCDGSILPALYLEYGQDFARHVDGMFAIAVVDTRGAGPVLVLAVDGLGIKSLYYQRDPASGEVYFASELPALLAFPGVRRTLSQGALDEYLTTKTLFGENTVFEEIHVLVPGTTAVFSRGRGHMIRRPLERPSHAPAQDLYGAAQDLLSLLWSEVARLLQGDVPPSAITSGGLDSGILTVLAKMLFPELETFNIAYKGHWPLDERQFASAIAHRAGTRHHQVELDPADIPALLPEVMRHMGQPNADPITVSSYVLFEAIREAGLKMTLSGDGADEIFGGYDRLRTAMAAPPGAGWMTDYVEALAAVPRALREKLYTPAYRHYLDTQGRTADRLTEQLATSGKPRLEALTDLEVEQRLPSYHLRRVDHMSMAHGVEVRPVFCQARVVQFGRALPPKLRISGHEVKRVLYRAADGLLPAAILDRPKQPFTLPIVEMLRPGHPLFAYAQEVLSPSNMQTGGQIQPKAVRYLLAEQSLRPSGSTALAVWSLLVFEVWLQQLSDTSGLRVAA